VARIDKTERWCCWRQKPPLTAVVKHKDGHKIRTCFDTVLKIVVGLNTTPQNSQPLWDSLTHPFTHSTDGLEA